MSSLPVTFSVVDPGIKVKGVLSGPRESRNSMLLHPAYGCSDDQCQCTGKGLRVNALFILGSAPEIADLPVHNAFEGLNVCCATPIYIVLTCLLQGHFNSLTG